MTSEAICLTYRGHRSRRPNLSARVALQLAREAVADPAKRLYGSQTPAGRGAKCDNGGYWTDRPEALGLRFLGFADELGGRYGSAPVSERGWFADDDQSEVYRACVYIAPSRDGRTRYVPAYREGSEDRRGGHWEDTSSGRFSDSAMIFWDDIELGQAGGAGDSPAGADLESEARDAARYANGRAERAAEEAREYREADRAGQKAGRALEEAREARESFLRLRADMKRDGRPAAESICQALQGTLADLVGTWRRGKAKAERLASDWEGRADLAESFKEGRASVC